MEKTDLFLGYRYIKASVEISVSSESETLLSIDVCRMLQMSSGQRPWQLHVIPFDLVTVSEKKGVISVSLMNETIEASCNFTLNKKGTLEAEISWKNNSQESLTDTVLALVLPIQESQLITTVIPSKLYCNGAVPANYFNVFEEHRVSIPAVNCQFMHSAHTVLSQTILPIPSSCQLNPDFDNEWSFGIIPYEQSSAIAMLSGAVAFDGMPDQIYTKPGTTETYERGYFTFPPNSQLTKRFVIAGSLHSVPEEAQKDFVSLCYEQFNPTCPAKIYYNEFLKLKDSALQCRYDEKLGIYENVIVKDTNEIYDYKKGSSFYAPSNLLAAWCDAAFSLHVRNAAGIKRAKKCADFFVNANNQMSCKALRYLHCNLETMEWSNLTENQVLDSHEFGKTMLYLADIIKIFREHYLEVQQEWLDCLCTGCDFLSAKSAWNANGMLPQLWDSNGLVSTAPATPFGNAGVCALVKAYLLVNKKTYLDAAEKLFKLYYEAVLNRSDSICNAVNQKEYDAYFLMAAMELYSATENQLYLDAAAYVANRLITFVYFQNQKTPENSCLSQKKFTGLSFVSTQSHCIHSLFPCYELKQLAEITENKFYGAISKLTTNAILNNLLKGDSQETQKIAGESFSEIYCTNWSEDGSKALWRNGFSLENSLNANAWMYRQILLHVTHVKI